MKAVAGGLFAIAGAVVIAGFVVSGQSCNQAGPAPAFGVALCIFGLWQALSAGDERRP